MFVAPVDFPSWQFRTSGIVSYNTAHSKHPAKGNTTSCFGRGDLS